MRRPHRAAHRSIWLALLVAIPAIFAAAFALRQDVDRPIPPERLAPPSDAATEN